MSLIILFSFLLNLAFSSPLTLNWKVVGGRNALDGVYPYQVSLQRDKSHICGATIVAREWIVTAAHCVRGQKHLSIACGSNKLSKMKYSYPVLEAHVHANYSHTAKINDVAILKVHPITFNEEVSKIDVETEFVGAGVIVTLTGWGALSHDSLIPDILQEIDLTTTTIEYCNSQHNKTIYNTEICTLTKQHTGACNGDSGSPLVQLKENGFVLTGIVSWGEPCAIGIPDVQSRVSSFFNWFNERCNNCLNK